MENGECKTKYVGLPGGGLRRGFSISAAQTRTATAEQLIAYERASGIKGMNIGKRKTIAELTSLTESRRMDV